MSEALRSLRRAPRALRQQQERERRLEKKVQQISFAYENRLAEQNALEIRAALKIQSAYKGAAMRRVYQRAKREVEAALLLQRYWRGKKGRDIVTQEKIKKNLVVRTEAGLEDLLARSTLKSKHDPWHEYRDDSTNAVFYYNTQTKATSWRAPEVFLKNLICDWPQCRKQFATSYAYHQHRRLEHFWFCLACEVKNSAINYPSCAVCGFEMDAKVVQKEETIIKFRMSELAKAQVDDGQSHFEQNLKSLQPPLIPFSATESQSVGSRRRSTKHGCHNKMTSARKGSSTAFFTTGMQIIGELQQEAEESTKAQNLGYTGDKLNGKRHGVGKYEHLAGDCYVGEWLEGQKHGHGVLKKTTGLTYTGMWKQGLKHGTGEIWHPSGEKFVGEFHYGKIKGRGALFSPSGDFYEGEWDANAYHGSGVFQKINGDKYLGEFRNGRAHGRGVLRFGAGYVYKGEFRENMKWGKGTLTYPDGSSYKGGWERDRFHGLGVYTNNHGDKYEGHWFRGLRHGRATIYFGEGSHFSGTENAKQGIHREDSSEQNKNTNYKNEHSREYFDGHMVKDKAQGFGVYRYRNGDYYEGNWLDNKKHGYGKIIWASGSSYVGIFSDGKFHGKGTLSLANGTIYRGQWRRNQRDGHGQLLRRTPSGDIYKEYEGLWKNNRKEGRGTMNFQNGDVYSGEWKDNRRHGYGRMQWREGQIYEGYWEMDLCQGEGKFWFPFGKEDRRLFLEYEGAWRENLKHGRGRKYGIDGSTYDGDWFENQRHGEGTLTFPNGDRYKGEFYHDQIQGLGEYASACDSYRYEGEWINNMRQGSGREYIKESKATFIGSFHQDKRHGAGKILFANGHIHECEWEHGELKGSGSFLLVAAESRTIRLPVFNY